MSPDSRQVINPDDGLGCMFILVVLVLLGGLIFALILLLFVLFG